MVTFLPKEQQLWVNTPHGLGLVICVESHLHDNYTWTVINSEDGAILHYKTTQLRAAIHHTLEINLKDQKPSFPSGCNQHYRTGKKQKRAILDDKGKQVALFEKGQELLAARVVEMLNSQKVDITK